VATETRAPDVLIVDDERLICHFLEQVVKKLGANAYKAETVGKARELLETREFDIALLDKNLPDESGISLLKHLKQKHPRTEVLILTGYANLESAIEALRAGAFDYLVKPFDADAISHRVQMALERRRMLSENVKMQGMLVQADRMASIGTLAAGVAHEINNPLAFMLSNLEYIEMVLPKFFEDLGVKEPPPQMLKRMKEIQAALREAREGGNRVSFIVRDIKTFARGDEEAKGPVDARRVLDSAAKIAWSQIRHRAQLQKDYKNVPDVHGNEARLAQVFLNLLVNAADAIPEGKASQNEIKLSTSLDDQGRVVVEVRDSGAGIPAENLKRIFDPFFTTKPVGVGTGLGLSICHNIITTMGGEISVESEIGKGTAFKVTLPVSTAEKRELSTAAINNVVRGRGKVMVIDDEPLIAMSVSRLLGEDYDVLALTDARTALERVKKGETFDVILCDLMMPVMSGMDVFAELNKMAPNQAGRMVFVTGGAVTVEAREFLDKSTNRKVEKPFDLAKLLSAINEVLAASPPVT
jgi:signal transduction histidine kinase